jgi:hypothetical protein
VSGLSMSYEDYFFHIYIIREAGVKVKEGLYIGKGGGNE